MVNLRLNVWDVQMDFWIWMEKNAYQYVLKANTVLESSVKEEMSQNRIAALVTLNVSNA